MLVFWPQGTWGLGSWPGIKPVPLTLEVLTIGPPGKPPRQPPRQPPFQIPTSLTANKKTMENVENYFLLKKKKLKPFWELYVAQYTLPKGKGCKSLKISMWLLCDLGLFLKEWYILKWKSWLIKTNCSFYIFRAQFTKTFKFLASLFKPTTKITLEFILIDIVSAVSNLLWSRWALLLWESQGAEPEAAEQSWGVPKAGDAASSVVYGMFTPPLSAVCDWCWLLRNSVFAPLSQLEKKLS